MAARTLRRGSRGPGLAVGCTWRAACTTRGMHQGNAELTRVRGLLCLLVAAGSTEQQLRLTATQPLCAWGPCDDSHRRPSRHMRCGRCEAAYDLIYCQALETDMLVRYHAAAGKSWDEAWLAVHEYEELP